MITESRGLYNPESELIYSPEIANFIVDYRDELLQMMEQAIPLKKGEISDIRPELKGMYSNSVVMYEFDQVPGQEESSNGRKIYKLLYGEGSILCVYKPRSGERESRLREFDIIAQYPREVGAYVVDVFCDLGIVPPVIEKQIEDDIGSLQIYIPPKLADIPPLVPSIDKTIMYNGRGWKKMAMLDVLIDNRDRYDHNYLVCKGDNSIVYAIDHGLSFSPIRSNYSDEAYKYFRNNPESAFLDDDLRGSLQRMLDHGEDALENALPEYIQPYTYKIFQHARDMLAKGTLLVK